MSSRGSVLKALDLIIIIKATCPFHSANLASYPPDAYISHWRRHKMYSAKHFSHASEKSHFTRRHARAFAKKKLPMLKGLS